jgi:hypothetical protein
MKAQNQVALRNFQTKLTYPSKTHFNPLHLHPMISQIHKPNIPKRLIQLFRNSCFLGRIAIEKRCEIDDRDGGHVESGVLQGEGDLRNRSGNRFVWWRLRKWKVLILLLWICGVRLCKHVER